MKTPSTIISPSPRSFHQGESLNESQLGVFTVAGSFTLSRYGRVLLSLNPLSSVAPSSTVTPVIFGRAFSSSELNIPSGIEPFAETVSIIPSLLIPALWKILSAIATAPASGASIYILTST